MDSYIFGMCFEKLVHCASEVEKTKSDSSVMSQQLAKHAFSHFSIHNIQSNVLLLLTGCYFNFIVEWLSVCYNTLAKAKIAQLQHFKHQPDYVQQIATDYAGFRFSYAILFALTLMLASITSAMEFMTSLVFLV